MGDSKPPSARELATSERERAFARFNSVFEVHQAVLQIFETLSSMPNSMEALKANIQLRKGMDPRVTQSQLNDYVQEMFTIVDNEKASGYATVRSSTLISICGAFEYLVKATFVSHALEKPDEAASLLAKKKIRLLASDVLGAPPSEQWHVIADRLFEQLADDERQMHKRVRVFLLEFTFLSDRADQTQRIEEAFEKIELEKFDEAFLIRNCLVHNGGRVSAALAHRPNWKLGELIHFESGSISPYVRPLREIAGLMNILWLVI